MILHQQMENHALQQLVYHKTVKLSPLAIGWRRDDHLPVSEPGP